MREDRGEVVLKKNEERRLLAGHRWVFSNEIGTCPPKERAPLLVDVRSSSGRLLGTGLYNPHSLIAVRLLEGRVTTLLSSIEEGIDRALAQRTELGRDGDDGVRLVHSEGDGLPGLVVDRYGDFLTVQITTRAMEAVSGEVLGILSARLRPRGIRIDRSVGIREAEGLPVEADCFEGDMPDEIAVRIGGQPLRFSLKEGQKTGLFLDQKDNIRSLAPLLARPSVLDAYCYVGAWSSAIRDQKNGVRLTGVDASERAIGFYRTNVPEGRGVCSDFLSWGRKTRESGERFDSVILDPPAFIKSRRLIREGIEGYHAAFRLGLSLLAPRGVFVACSCSALLSWEDFSGVLRAIFQKEGRRGRMIYQGRAAWDHPRLLAMPELDYLKCAAFWVDPAR